ncbi:MAG: hypothetical protein OXU36_12775 [Candidatus Poribacteria bacterium]|nr:hypothetical protein [Candidatus Poribacteria bacterium]
MKKTAFLCWIKPVLILSFVCFFAFTATAQNYYPADIGNMWVFDSSDGEAQTTYTLEGPEIIDGQEHVLLKITTEELATGVSETDQYFLTVGNEAIKLHRTTIEHSLATITADFPTPATFFPLQLVLGDKWQIAADAEAKLIVGEPIAGKSVTNLEVIGFEDVVTPAGTFQNCAKVQLDLVLTAAGGFLNLNINQTTYQWFAPDIGPIQYQDSDGVIFSLINSNLLTVPEEPDMTEETSTPEQPLEEAVTPELSAEEDPIPESTPEEDTAPEPVPYDVTGDGIVNILDLTFVAARFGEPDTDADVTGDSTVNILDLVLIAQNFSN